MPATAGVVALTIVLFPLLGPHVLVYAGPRQPIRVPPTAHKAASVKLKSNTNGPSMASVTGLAVMSALIQSSMIWRYEEEVSCSRSELGTRPMPRDSRPVKRSNFSFSCRALLHRVAARGITSCSCCATAAMG